MKNLFCASVLLAFAVVLPLQAESPARSTDAPKPLFLATNAQMDAVAGRYQNTVEPDNSVSVYRDGGKLVAEAERMFPREWTLRSATLAQDINSKTQWTFALSPDGKATSLSVGEGDAKQSFTRVGEPVHHHFRPYSRQEVMIPMRDGVRLHAIILRPTDTKEPLPFLVDRTPYGVDGYGPETIVGARPELARSGYIFVEEDIRGRYKSEGKFVMSRPLVAHGDKSAVDESTDAYDTVAWLLKNIPNNNGRAGALGTSYDGFTATETGIQAHPAVKAISPQAPMIDVWMGDDFFHNGAFRQSYGYDYALGMESSKENTFGKLDKDAYDYFLSAGSFADAMHKSGAGDLPTWHAFLEHPAYDEFWRARGVEHHLTQLTVPTLTVGGWWDQEDMWGPQEEYAKLEPLDKAGDNFIVLGPWKHGQWGQTTRHLGALDFGATTTDQYRSQIEAPFFAHYLKDAPGFDLKNAATFQTGSNTWHHYAQWPPAQSHARNLYLGANGSLSFTAPASSATTSATTYVSDPKNPVPYRKRPIEATYAPGSHWGTWMAEDQRFLKDRSDVASWKTKPLTKDVTVTGNVIADLFAATSGTDSDWVVKLIDVYPDNASDKSMDGYQLIINAEIFRGRYVRGFTAPTALVANAPTEYQFSLHGADHVFLKGHRIMVQVQSSWFPLYDRNPQTYVENIMTAKPDAYKPATQKIFANSHILLPVVGEAAQQ
ncbi:MAG TPA: CocE/NonD family hydrolase [Acidobacteriaceae bacterium]|nr:CocE/NonD family hydrolase [Acidobacteriaceae bacterium]